MNRMDEYVEKTEAQLKIFRAKLDEMAGKAALASADVRMKGQKQYDALRERLSELRTAGQARWEKLVEGVEKAKNDLAATMQKKD